MRWIALGPGCPILPRRRTRSSATSFSERVLKMPRERTGDTDKPFKDVPRNTLA